MEFLSSKPAIEAVITGGSCGLGAEMARQLADRGLSVLVVGRRIERLQAVCKAINDNSSGSCYYYICNLDIAPELEALANLISNRESLTILINNAGFSTEGRFLDNSLEKHLSLSKTHMDAVITLSHAALPALLENKGALINISSIAAMLPTPVTPLYGASKQFIKSFTMALGSNYKKEGLRATTACPGFIRSEFHRKLGLDPATFYKDSGLFKAHSTTFVASKILRDAERGKLLSVPGINYKMMYLILKHCPDWLLTLFLPRVRTSRVNEKM